jgi:LysM repeat protein
MPARRLLAFILLNIVVSATVVLAILFWWDSRQEESADLSPELSLISTAAVGAETAPPEDISEIPAESPAEEAEEMPRYTVQSGDTLGKISVEFDVDIPDILLANNMDNPNFLQVGQELIIPVGGIPTATPPPTETPITPLTPTPLSVELPDEGEAIVKIGEVLAAGNLAEEVVSIVNTGTRPIALLGWRLSDAQGHTYTFGQVTLFGEGAAILVHTARGQEGPGDLYWGFEEAIWEIGESVTLVDAEGTVRAIATVGSP